MPQSNLQDINLPDFSKASVLVVGDLMLDRYWSGPTARISPEAPIPVVKVEDTENRVGGAGNVALNIASLGARASLLAIVGNDEAGDVLGKKLEAAEVNCTLQVSEDKPTITKLRVMSRHQQMIRLDFEENLSEEGGKDKFRNNFTRLLENSNFDVIVFSDYEKGTLVQVSELISIAKSKDIPCLVDPKGREFSKYSGATLITPNRDEFQAVVDSFENETEMELAAKSLLEKLSLEHLLVTRSEEGMTLYNSTGEPQLHFGARASDVFDVTGAGDTVLATLASSLAAGSKISDAVFLANCAAGIVVGKSGTAAIALSELESELSEGRSSRGLVPLSHLKTLVKKAQNNGQKVVMTNGCFDILHAGHISYLEEAKRLGDKLIVAVNSDDSVRRLKGEARPINTVERRMQVLAGLQAVDWVIPFEEDTPAELVANVLPDILVKGGDWKVEEIAGGEAVVANGGQVMSLSFKEGHSTTAIIDLIKERENIS